jgi:hypothetical protein
MEILSLDEFKNLAQRAQDPSITILMPTHRAGPDTQQDPIRFRNLLREVERRLQDDGMGRRNVEAFLQPAQALLEDGEFWRHQQEGLALYLSDGDFHTYRLPYAVDEQAIISQSYYTKPLLPLFTNNGHYFILAVSLNEVRMFEATRDGVGEVELPGDTPTSLAEALKYDDIEQELQFSTGTPGGDRDGMGFGHEVGDETRKIRIGRYLNKLDHGLKPLYRGQEAPLVLAGVDYLLPIYRKVSEYPHILEEGIEGSPEGLRAEELRERAWPLVEPHFRQELEAVLAAYGQGAGTGQAVDDIEEVVAAAHHGRVDTLLVAVDAQVWGTFDPENGKVQVDEQAETQEAGRDDRILLADSAATQTLLNGGTVYALPQEELPTQSPVAALLRY